MIDLTAVKLALRAAAEEADGFPIHYHSEDSDLSPRIAMACIKAFLLAMPEHLTVDGIEPGFPRLVVPLTPQLLISLLAKAEAAGGKNV